MPGIKARAAGWFSTVPAPSPQQGEGDVVRVLSGYKIPGGQPLARVIILVVVCAYGVVEAIEQVTSTFPSRAFVLGVGLTALVLVIGLMVYVTSEAVERWPLRQRLITLLAEALVIFLPMIVLGKVWAAMAGFFAGSALLLLSGWMAWALFGLTVGGMLVGCIIATAVLSNLAGYLAAYLPLSTLVAGLFVFGLARLSVLVRYVQAKRGELAQVAVINERMRFARDLHDLLGYSLSSITLKSEVTRRLVGSNPGRARDELGEVLDIARKALADVRSVASGYRNISLAKEASSVTSLLAAAGIDARIEIDCDALDDKVGTALATVLREAVTNMLRHSTARNCTVEASVAEGTVRLLVSNDGVPRSAVTGRRGGGLENLAARMTAIGGTLNPRVRPDGWFEVLAEAPLTPAHPSEPASEAEDSQHAPEPIQPAGA